ncbi:hypothetical protein A1O3_05309 [Capronia epimyces CBS 606.96]|uniref:DUF1760-domain-containing protein n=1 Tax=Capronia epimyces CBS 606.96 TaxID=1182542 RepID=W9YQU2_9EURO|nr:uncharacterized protein A1O3_05309 [Capronia epimyces CBS 606.96]EXJ84639.1 hypothetical protein A1O3_05309 [Capronia epimyces CBS 606.96]
MASDPHSAEDPLLAALPPVTDYITYLTILEYQLTPQNLPTLTRLLCEDDGTLAQEIGWDLLKLVLPLLSHCPDEATHCLEVVARRGNPREVVVRVAEELEKLGDAGDDDDLDEDSDELNPADAEDELPTFAGEAPRIHLGAMTLEGVPEAPKQVEQQDVGQQEDGSRSAKSSASSRPLKLQALLNMLSILHPRIKTQYPSRFLATSLPAALGAYRRIPITTAVTASFLTMLEALAGKRRPPLPPRDSSTRGATSAPLPDPEARAEEEQTGINTSSPEERTITSRLLDAVLLEVLDEYLSSLSSQELSSMSWTARLREKLEPQRIVPGRPTESQLWQEREELKVRDALVARFGALSRGMNIHAATEIKRLLHEDEDETEDSSLDKEQEASEYPTSPSQIPFPRAGVIFLYAYESYVNAESLPPLLTTTELTKLTAHSFPLSATPSIPSPALQDALLSLLYRRIHSPSATDAPPSPAKFLLLLSTLTQLFTITPWPALRDSAHHIATKLLHAYPDPKVRLEVIVQTLRGSTLSTNWAEIEDDPDPEPGIDEETGLTRSTSALQPHPIPLAPPQQIGALKAVGVDWLKDEFANSIRHQDTGLASIEQPLARTEGLDLSTLIDGHADLDKDDAKDSRTPSLLDLLFPQDLPRFPPQPITSGQQSNTDPEADDSDDLLSFLLDIPYFIATLNLLCVILPHLPSSSPSSTTDVKPRLAAHVRSLSTASNFLLALLQHATTSTAADQAEGTRVEDTEFLAESRADIYALEDACTRATAALEKVIKHA